MRSYGVTHGDSWTLVIPPPPPRADNTIIRSRQLARRITNWPGEYQLARQCAGLDIDIILYILYLLSYILYRYRYYLEGGDGDMTVVLKNTGKDGGDEVDERRFPSSCALCCDLGLATMAQRVRPASSRAEIIHFFGQDCVRQPHPSLHVHLHPGRPPRRPQRAAHRPLGVPQPRHATRLGGDGELPQLAVRVDRLRPPECARHQGGHQRGRHLRTRRRRGGGRGCMGMSQPPPAAPWPPPAAPARHLCVGLPVTEGRLVALCEVDPDRLQLGRLQSRSWARRGRQGAKGQSVVGARGQGGKGAQTTTATNHHSRRCSPPNPLLL
jgi:hypothetical protein